MIDPPAMFTLSVDLSAVADLENDDLFFMVVDRIDHAPIPLANAISFATLHFFAAMGPWLLLKIFDLFEDLGGVVAGDGTDFFFSAFFQRDFIGGRHALSLSRRIPSFERVLSLSSRMLHSQRRLP